MGISKRVRESVRLTVHKAARVAGTCPECVLGGSSRIMWSTTCLMEMLVRTRHLCTPTSTWFKRLVTASAERQHYYFYRVAVKRKGEVHVFKSLDFGEARLQ